MPRKNKSVVIVKNLSPAAAHADLFKFDGAVFDDAVNLLKACFFQRVEFLGKGVLLCYDDESKTVYLADESNNIAKLNMGELKRWARCQSCGVEGFVDGEAPEFINAVMCVKCHRSEL